MITLKSLLVEAQSALQAWNKEIRKPEYTPLTTEQFKKIKQLMTDPETTDVEKKKIKEKVIKSNYRLVPKIIYSSGWDKLGVPVEDLVVEGIRGLFEAWDKFDWTKDYKYGTYAYHFVKRNVLDFYKQYGKTVKYPENVMQSALEKDKELAKQGLEPEPVYRQLSLDLPMGGSGDDVFTLQDVIPSEDDESESGMDVNAMVGKLKGIIQTLPKQEYRKIATYNFIKVPLEGYAPKTPLEWGKELGVNTETARNWINKINDFVRKKFK